MEKGNALSEFFSFSMSWSASMNFHLSFAVYFQFAEFSHVGMPLALSFHDFSNVIALCHMNAYRLMRNASQGMP